MAKKKEGQKKYNVVGLELSDYMPLQFQNSTYDLANLSDDELAYLKQFPEEFPYLGEANSN